MWFTAAAQLIGSELQTVPLNTANPYAIAPTPANPWETVGLALIGVAVLGGAYYFLVKR